MSTKKHRPYLPSARLFSWVGMAVGAIFWAGNALPVPSQATPGWNPVSLGFSAEVLLYHGNAMWAAGSAESVAASTDGGRHWQTKHTDPGGGLLLSLAFVNERFGYAAGTGRRVLMTEDGGQTWSPRITVPETIFTAAFGDAQHGVVRARSALLATIDGGQSWKPVVPANDPGWSRRLPYTGDMVALDASHFLVVVNGDGGEFLWTADGGATWNANYPSLSRGAFSWKPNDPNQFVWAPTWLNDGAGGSGVFVTQGEFWSIGSEEVGRDRQHVGEWLPMAVRSPDGIHWEHIPVNYRACHWRTCRGCTAQGCFAGASSFVPFSRLLEPAANENAAPASGQEMTPAEPLGRVPRLLDVAPWGQETPPAEPLARFPKHVLSDQWARSGSTLCLLARGTIECTALTPVAMLRTKEDESEWDHSSFAPLHPTPYSGRGSRIEPLNHGLKHGAQCIYCAFRSQYQSTKRDTGQVKFKLSFTIQVDGRVGALVLPKHLAEDVAARLRSEIAGWLFEPATEDGRPTALNVTVRAEISVWNPDTSLADLLAHRQLPPPAWVF
jgi:photosystem II stability/assembly factor-like uncharacterized protein